jgi:hypothetical protein
VIGDERERAIFGQALTQRRGVATQGRGAVTQRRGVTTQTQRRRRHGEVPTQRQGRGDGGAAKTPTQRRGAATRRRVTQTRNGGVPGEGGRFAWAIVLRSLSLECATSDFIKPESREKLDGLTRVGGLHNPDPYPYPRRPVPVTLTGYITPALP